MSNARLIEALDYSRVELAKRAEVERSLRDITARISAAADLPAVLQSAVDEAARLMRADGARIDLVDPASGLLRWAYASGALRPDADAWPDDPDETLDQGIAGQAVVSGRAQWTGDYLHDDRFPHGSGADTYVEGAGIHSVMAAPLIGESGPFGALTIYSDAADLWSAADATLLVAIADQAAITITTTRLIDELDRSRDALARKAEAEQALREIAARITVLREPAEILRDVVVQASRLVRGHGAILDLLDPTTGNLHWAYDDGFGSGFTDEEKAQLWISVGVGATGMAVAEDRVVVAGDDLAAQFPPSPESTEFYERTGFHSMIAAPITGENGPLGVIEVYSKERDAFTEIDASLIEALAGQAAIAITNARLIEELARSREALGRTAEAERTLREIAARVSAMRDKDEILQSVIDASVRLLGATGAMIDMLGGVGMAEAWTSQEAGERAVANLPCSTRSSSSPTPGCPVARSGPGSWSGPGTTSRTTGSSTRPRAMPSSARPASARSSRRRSSIATSWSAPSPCTATAPTRSTRPTRACWRRSPTRPRSPSRTRTSSRSSNAPRPRRPAAPTRNAHCARSRRACRPSSTRPRSSSGSPTRRRASSIRTGRASTSTTRRSMPCAGRTRPATRCRSCPIGRRPAASSPARPWPASRSPSSARSSPRTTSPTSGSIISPTSTSS